MINLLTQILIKKFNVNTLLWENRSIPKKKSPNQTKHASAERSLQISLIKSSLVCEVKHYTTTIYHLNKLLQSSSPTLKIPTTPKTAKSLIFVTVHHYRLIQHTWNAKTKKRLLDLKIYDIDSNIISFFFIFLMLAYYLFVSYASLTYDTKKHIRESRFFCFRYI